MATKKTAKVVETTPVVTPAVAITPLEQAKIDKAEAIQRIKDLKAQETETKAKKETKGIMVTFTNKAGETITGKGVLYYVVRSGNKLHYKEASAATIVEEAPAEA